MKPILYQRIKELCKKHGTSISKLESELGFGNSSIKRWGSTSSPSIDKITKVANYFNVSIDYLIGREDIASKTSDVINDKEVISYQRAREKMIPTDKNKSYKMLRLGFGYAFSDDDIDNDEEKDD